ncbi:hypothetical protein [Paludisphaera mucosa]|uniref:Uncharacterized protein n=1 Tax=Paludisphaera mucosa TaxID=3030827 RepID=A0ABT6F6M6_9BACT|nr:hypothetical protein [Paludisphaera mucosa]MDG3003241.1 hypothetical protein [Paludisphaera mucosa]
MQVTISLPTREQLAIALVSMVLAGLTATIVNRVQRPDVPAPAPSPYAPTPAPTPYTPPPAPPSPDWIPTPTPRPAVDPDAGPAAAGRSYAAALVRGYSAGWRTAADKLEAGAAIPDALAAVGPAWTAYRVPFFDRDVQPVFDQVVPSDSPPAAVTPDKRRALARAFRAFAAGLAP